MSDQDLPLIEYPQSFPVTVIGRNESDFEVFVMEILRRHSPNLEEEKVSSRVSRNGNYRSVRATFFAESREHLEALYSDLRSHQRVLMLL